MAISKKTVSNGSSKSHSSGKVDPKTTGKKTAKYDSLLMGNPKKKSK